MAWYDPFLLGPLGAMRALPSPPHGSEVKRTPVRRGGVREPLLGAPVADVWKVLDRFEFEWDEAYAADLAPLARAWRRVGGGRVRRLLDPMHGPNLLTVDASLTGAASRSLAAFDAGTRPMVFVPSLDLPAALDGSSGLLRWSVPADTADAVRADLGRPVPVLARPVTVSMWARGAGQVAAQYEPVNLDGTAAAAAVRGAFLTLTAAWQRTSVTLPAGAAFPGLTAALAVAAGAARTVETCGWQAEHATAPSTFADGGACPRVRIADLDPGYKRGNRRRIKLVLEEV